jgi:hypothetical protein
MVERRNLMGGGLVAGLTALMVPTAEAAAVQRDGGDDQTVARAVDGLRQTIDSRLENLQSGPWRRILQLREQQRIWLRSTQKFPDFIEIGVEVWENVYDWHVRYQQPVNVARMPDGRYAMVFMFTTLLLRPDANPEFIGLAFDADVRRPAP